MKNSLEKVRQEFERGGIKSSIILAEILEEEEKQNALEFLLVGLIEKSFNILYSNEIPVLLNSLDRSLTKDEAKKIFDIRFASENNSVYELFDLINVLPENCRLSYCEKLLILSFEIDVAMSIKIATLIGRPLTNQEKGTIIKKSLSKKDYTKIPKILSDLGLKKFETEKWRRFFKKELADQNYYCARDITTLVDNNETKTQLLTELWQLTKDEEDQRISELIATDLGFNWTEEAQLKTFRQFLSAGEYTSAHLFAHKYLPSRDIELKQEIFAKAMENGNYNAAKMFNPDKSRLLKEQLFELLNNAIDKNDRKSVDDVSIMLTFYDIQ
ncbi:MAG: hypothetical protein ACOYMB_01600 [Patescibacteria group bacterium]